MPDIEDIEDIKIFVDGFYAKVQEDDLLADVFALRVEKDGWGKHLQRMYDFWNSVLFFQRTYKGNPFSKHMDLPVSEKHFIRWISLFNETIDTHFEGERAEDVKRRVSNMATMFQVKMNYYAKNPDTKPIM